MILALAPAVIAAASMVDSKVLDGFRSWLHNTGSASHYADLLRVISPLALVRLVANVRENP
jgi:hypothetical protein